VKAVILGDLQARQTPFIDDEGRDVWFEALMETLWKLVDMITQHDVTDVFILGDVFHVRGRLQVHIVNQIFRVLYALHTGGSRVWLLVGNHDRDPLGREHALEIFKSFAIVIDEPMSRRVDGEEIVAIPYLPAPDATTLALRDLTTDRTSIVLLHCGIKGMRLASGHVWEDGIRRRDLPRHAATFLGHYHRFRQVGERAWYVGSFLPVDWSDAGRSCVIGVYENGRVRFQPFHAIRFVVCQASDLPTLFGAIEAGAKDHLAGAFIRVDGVRASEADRIRALLLEREVRWVEIEHVQSVSDVEQIEPATRLDDLLAQYVMTSETAGLSKGRLLRIGRKILDEARRAKTYQAEK